MRTMYGVPLKMRVEQSSGLTQAARDFFNTSSSFGTGFSTVRNLDDLRLEEFHKTPENSLNCEWFRKSL
jgi:hypothetical protein